MTWTMSIGHAGHGRDGHGHGGHKDKCKDIDTDKDKYKVFQRPCQGGGHSGHGHGVSSVDYILSFFLFSITLSRDELNELVCLQKLLGIKTSPMAPG